MTDHYATLGVPKDATAEEIKKAYRKQRSAHHPDKTGDAADRSKFNDVQDAFQTLQDPDARAKYDREQAPHSTRSQKQNPSASDAPPWKKHATRDASDAPPWKKHATRDASDAPPWKKNKTYDDQAFSTNGKNKQNPRNADMPFAEKPARSAHDAFSHAAEPAKAAPFDAFKNTFESASRNRTSSTFTSAADLAHYLKKRLEKPLLSDASGDAADKSVAAIHANPAVLNKDSAVLLAKLLRGMPEHSFSHHALRTALATHGQGIVSDETFTHGIHGSTLLACASLLTSKTLSVYLSGFSRDAQFFDARERACHTAVAAIDKNPALLDPSSARSVAGLLRTQENGKGHEALRNALAARGKGVVSDETFTDGIDGHTLKACASHVTSKTLSGFLSDMSGPRQDNFTRDRASHDAAEAIKTNPALLDKESAVSVAKMLQTMSGYGGGYKSLLGVLATQGTGVVSDETFKNGIDGNTLKACASHVTSKTLSGYVAKITDSPSDSVRDDASRDIADAIKTNPALLDADSVRSMGTLLQTLSPSYEGHETLKAVMARYKPAADRATMRTHTRTSTFGL